jgi:hypothetical protein
MGLVNELQESAERDDVATVLRKAKRLSAKLSRQDINDWLEHEQSGYPDGAAIPDYRVIGVTVCYNTNGYVPAGYGMVKSGIEPVPGWSLDLTVPKREPISTLLSYVDAMDKGNDLYMPIDGDLAETIRGHLRSSCPEILRQLTFLTKFNQAQIRNIPEQVKNRVLDWACKLEMAGVTGDGVSFSAKEKEIAQSMVFNLTHCKVGQISGDGTNVMGPRDG